MSSTFAFVTIFLITAFITTGNAIRCWTCSTDLNPRCGDPFNTTVPHKGVHGYSLDDCNAQSSGGSYPYLSASKYVCKKSKQYVEGVLSIIRSCALQMPDEPVGVCQTTPASNRIRVVYCETCDTDGCNSGPAINPVPLLATLSLTALLFVITKLL